MQNLYVQVINSLTQTINDQNDWHTGRCSSLGANQKKTLWIVGLTKQGGKAKQ